jgi:hypothetical protein
VIASFDRIVRLAFSQPMSPQGKPRCVQPGLPAISCADRRRVIEQSLFLLLGSQPGESGMQRLLRREERLLAVEHRRICGAGILQALDLAGAERQLDASYKCRVEIRDQIGIPEPR